MRFDKVVKAVYVAERNFSKDGKVLKFYDLQYFVEGEGVGKVGVPEELAVKASQCVGKDVTLCLELEQDRRSQWLYRLNLLDIVPVASDKPRAVVNS